MGLGRNSVVADIDIAKPPNVLRLDVNGDGVFTVSDTFGWLGHVFFLPGDWSIWAAATYAPSLTKFLELGPSAYGGILSGFVSAVAWLAILIIVIIVYSSIREFDRVLTHRIVGAYSEVRRRMRIAMTLLGYRARRIVYDKPAAETESFEFAESIELSVLEVAALRLHAGLKPGYALAESEVAAALKVRRNQAQDALGKLKRLNLLETAVGGGGGETAYRLTRAGRGFLVFRRFDKGAAFKAGAAAKPAAAKPAVAQDTGAKKR